METEIIKVNPGREDPEAIRHAGQILKNGGLVAFPTETVYGLGGDALLPDASRRIYAAKGRPSDNPLIVHIADTGDLSKIASEVPDEAYRLAELFWPGPLTMILPKSTAVPFETTGGLSTVAIRLPKHPTALALIKSAGGFVAAPSANTSGRPSPTLASHVREDLWGRIDLILDGGPVGIGVESTILDLTDPVPTILRPGAVTEEDLLRVLPEVRIDPGLISSGSDQRPKAPGMKYRHYAPKAGLTLYRGEASLVVRRIRALAEEHTLEGRQVGILTTEENVENYPVGTVLTIGRRRNPDTVALHLYEALRRFDELKVDEILAESYDNDGIGLAVMNRLTKAAGGKIIDVYE